MFSILLTLIVTLTTNVQIDILGNKTYVTFQHSYSETLDQDYAATYDVIFNTPTGLQTVGYFIVIPAGTSSATIHPHRITNGWTISSWELISWQAYQNE